MAKAGEGHWPISSSGIMIVLGCTSITEPAAQICERGLAAGTVLYPAESPLPVVCYEFALA
eukprot:634411-Rhodomonas_salina.1